jgi:hypothetical protein
LCKNTRVLWRRVHSRSVWHYADFAAGFVIHSLPGQPAFPVRLTSEIFQRCRAHLLRLAVSPPYTVYDPCCGSAYLLTTLAFTHWTEVQQVVGSDLDLDALALAERNAALLTLPGLEQRMADLANRAEQFGKPSHTAAVASATHLHARLTRLRQTHTVTSKIGRVNALSASAIHQYLAGHAVDIVITDIPYGQQSSWSGTDPQESHVPAWQLLDALHHSITPHTIIAITSNKQSKVSHEAYQRIEQLQIGKRRTVFFKLKP